MEDDVLSKLLRIRTRIHNLIACHIKYYSCCLKNINVEALELLEQLDYAIGSNIQQVHRISFSDLFRINNRYIANKLNPDPIAALELAIEAGVGKTILCLSIVEEWAAGKLFQEFQIVLFLPLSSGNVASASSLAELLSVLYADFKTDTCDKLARCLEKNKEHNVLIIADGWEDLQASQCQTGSFLHSLLFSNDIISTSSTTILITSRPRCIQTLESVIDRFIILTGFSKKAIESIIHSEFVGDFKRIRYLTIQLNTNRLMERMCSAPLNLVIVCNLCRSNDVESLPKLNTMTELCTKFVWTLAAASTRTRLSSYHDLSEKQQQLWGQMCKLAFRLIETDHDMFSKSEVSVFELKKVSYFGLIKPMSGSGDNLSFSFLHPHFEEYLATLYLAEQPQKQLEFMREMTADAECSCKTTTTFWHFFVSNYVRVVVNVDPDIITQVLNIICPRLQSHKQKYFIDLCHFSFEARHSIVDQQVFKLMSAVDSEVLRFDGHSLNLHDCAAMIHVIGNITQECEVEINFQDCHLIPELIDSLANALGDKSSVLQIRGLNLSNNKLNGLLAVDLFDRIGTTLKTLKVLILRKCDIGTKLDIEAMLSALANSLCQSLIHLDLSFNPISIAFLQTLQSHIKSFNTFAHLQNLGLKGSLNDDVSTSFLASFSDTLSSRCKFLQRFDLSDNNLGEPGNPNLRKMISQLLCLGRDFNLCLNDEYMSEVNDEFVHVMEESIKKKGTINHTMAHGVIVGPGRSGKNTLMNRLMGNGPPEPDSISPSTGVLENIVKCEVKKKLSTVATAVSNLEWKKLDSNEEALELIMTTARDYSAISIVSQPVEIKYIIKEHREESITNITDVADVMSIHDKSIPPSKSFAGQSEGKQCKISKNSLEPMPVYEQEKEQNDAVLYAPDLEPVDIFKRAVELRGMDALREHLESSWSLYLTNTGGQIEFQEYLPLLVCGPSIFFVTFPLHHDLEKSYDVCYEYPDGRIETYKSPATLLEELLQTLATINTSNFNSDPLRDSEAAIKPKIFFIGTHKDCLAADSAEEIIQEKDKLLQTYVRQTSLFDQGSIQFAKAPTRLIFTVNNLSNNMDEFEDIHTAVQKVIIKNEFTIKCPSSWLILSLILRAKHKSDQVLSFDKCFSIARQCGITDCKELKQALSFIHSRLGLIRYYNTQDLNTYVVIDPQVLFDKITELIVKTFTNDNVEVKEMEDFHQRGIIPIAVMQTINDSDSQLPFIWLTKLLNYLRIAALFTDNDGDKYFFPSALCHAPEPHSKQSPCLDIWPPLLVGFKSGFCPRGIPGALIKYLMTNEMRSNRSWNIIPNKIFKNQVSFAIQGRGIITLRILPTHLEVFYESEEDSLEVPSEGESNENELTKKTCETAYLQIRKGMSTVTSQCKECDFFFGFYCTLSICQAHKHPAQLEWDGRKPFKVLCKVRSKRGSLPKGCEIWNLQKKSKPGKAQLDKEIDADGVLKHIGQIADSMTEWEGRISEELKLTPADVASIHIQHPNKLKLQSRAALYIWKQRLGSDATYQKLIDVFERAGYCIYSEIVRNTVYAAESDCSDCDEPIPQPETYPHHKLLGSPSSSNLSPSPHKLSSSTRDEYVLVNPVTAQGLPEGDVCSQEELDSCNVAIVPLLSSKHKLPDTNSLLSANDKNLEVEEWFFPDCTRAEADLQLMMPFNSIGSYLVRNSGSTPGDYALSVRDTNRVRHYRIRQLDHGSFSIAGAKNGTFNTIQDLVAHHQKQKDGLCVSLIKPCVPLQKPQTITLSKPALNNEWEIDQRQISLSKKLHTGKFSEVFEGLLNGATPVAVYVCNQQTLTVDNFLQTTDLMKKLHHTNIIQLYAVCTKGEPMYIVTELMKHGNLLEYLRGEGRRLGISALIYMASQVAGGMAYLEMQCYIHRDLAARNILVGENLLCKVASFEMAQVISEPLRQGEYAPKWTAPEAALNKKFSTKSDVWSFGIVLYEIITYGGYPYHGMTNAEVLKQVVQGYCLPQPTPGCPDKFYRIMLNCWQQEPENRPTFETLQWQLQDYYYN